VDFLSDTNNLMLIGIAVLSGLMLIWPLIQKSRAGGSVTTTQAVQLINHHDAVILDVRPLATFQNGHIPHSRNVPLADLASKAPNLPKDKPVIVVCDRGQTSIGAAAKLRQTGLERVAVLDGGLNAWVLAGLPTSTKK
jgi:rhodanese-related sulfurtransferase